MWQSVNHVPTYLEYVAAINIKICLHLQNTIKLVSENIGNLSLYVCQFNKGLSEWTNQRFVVLYLLIWFIDSFI